MRLDALPVGARFTVTALPYLSGELLHLSECSATVRYDRSVEVEVGGKTFTRREPAITISCGTEVTPA